MSSKKYFLKIITLSFAITTYSDILLAHASGLAHGFNCQTVYELPAAQDYSGHICVYHRANVVYFTHPEGVDPHNPITLAPSGNQGNDPSNTCNPINIPSGNKFFTINMFTGEGKDPLDFNLYYNSHARPVFWTADYLQYLEIENDSITIHRPDGKRLNVALNNGALTLDSQRQETLQFVNDQYLLRLPDNTLETYNASGQLIRITYRSGISHNLSYSDDNRTITVSRFNQSLVLSLSQYNDLQNSQAPGEITANYSWYSSGGVRALYLINYENGQLIRQFSYSSPVVSGPIYLMTSMIDENRNRIASVEYDIKQRAISSEVGTPNSGIERTEITYHDDGSRTVTNSLGKQNTYHFTQFNGEYKMTQVEGHASANCAAANQAYTYDANGFMASKTDWKGNTTTYVNNDRGLEISRTEASGTPQARTVTTEWHPTFNLRTKVTEPERETIFTYDSNGRLTSQEVTAR